MIFGLGANLGDREATLLWALRELDRVAGPLEVASLYRSVAISSLARGGEGCVEESVQPDYLNTVAAGKLTAPIDARALLDRLKQLERRAGRRPAVRDAPRPLDIDLLMVGDVVLDLPELVMAEDGVAEEGAAEHGRWPGALRIPHRRMAERRFVLEPLAELAPDLRLPPGGRTIRELLPELGEGQEVERVGWSQPGPGHGPRQERVGFSG